MRFLVLLSLVAAVYADYCAKNLCPSGTHIACNNNGAWASTCPADAKLVDLTPYKAAIVKAHNEKRNTLANGQLSGKQPAVRMGLMEWDDELATLAALNVKQCKMAHDQCRSTETYKYAGQNLGSASYTGPVSRSKDDALITSTINSWWNENKDTTPAQLAKYPSSYSGPAIGHFTVMARQNNVRVGCAAARYTSGGWNSFLMACNYATTNIVNNVVYKAGPVASGCTTGKDSVYTGLCSKSEVFTEI